MSEQQEVNMINFESTSSINNNDIEEPNKAAAKGKGDEDIVIESDDQHEHDMVMPGFRFHPTEEELVEFYLRRKVEGKRFNVELITFLDLYRYDPWELPALAAIGEKEWFFYVPRDRKYRNGDRPNRVTTSGYWKATGADRMIRTENLRSIGLKKTLVFYSGKAPKGIRTSWIMNEYRLPHHDTERYQKAEISLCRVYKRAGVEDPRSLPSRSASSSRTAQSSSSSEKKQQSSSTMEKLQASFGGHMPHDDHDDIIQPSPPALLAPPQPAFHDDQPPENANAETEGSGSTTSDVSTTLLGLSKRKASRSMDLIAANTATNSSSTTLLQPNNSHEAMLSSQLHAKQAHMINCPNLLPNSCVTLFSTSIGSYNVPSNSIDDLHRLVNYGHQQQVPSGTGTSTIGQFGGHHQHQHHQQPQHYYYNQFHPLPMVLPPPSLPQSSSPSPQQQPLGGNNGMIPNFLPTAVSDRLWEWNPFPDQPNRDHPFK